MGLLKEISIIRIRTEDDENTTHQKQFVVHEGILMSMGGLVWGTIVLFLWMLPIHLVAQPAMDPNDAVSILNVWNDSTQPDSLRLKAIYDYAWDGYLYTQPDSAYYYSQWQYDFAKARGVEKSMADALNTQGTSLYLRGEYSSANEHHFRSLKLMEDVGNKKGIASVLNNIGNNYKYQSDYANAIKYYTRSKTVFEEIGYTHGVALTLGNIGVIYRARGDYARAIADYTLSLKLLEDIGDKRGVEISLNNIGSIYFEQGDYDSAIDYYTRGLGIAEEIGDKQGILRSLGNTGNAYRSLGKYTDAINYFSRSLNIAEEIGDKKGASASLNNIGLVYQSQSDYASARACFMRSLAIDEEIGDRMAAASSLWSIGNLYEIQGDYKKALDYGGRSAQIAKEIGAVTQIRNAANLLWKLHRKSGDYKQSLEMYELFVQMRDSIDSEQNQKEVIRQKFKYAYEKQATTDSISNAKSAEIKNAQIAQQQAEIRAKKNQQYGLFGGLGLMFALAAVFFTQRNRISTEKERSERLLLNILPEKVAEELKEKGHSDAQLINKVTVLFTDFKGFTALSEKVTPKELVKDLHECFSAFDRICEKYGIEKIKTIGDAYMAAGGLPTANQTHAQDVVHVALEMLKVVEVGKAKKIAAGLPYFEIRIGVHSGPVVAGIVGIKKFQYDIWGDTVNTASRMESSGEPGKVNISQSTYEMLKDNGDFTFIYRGKVAAKAKGELEMYFVESKI